MKRRAIYNQIICVSICNYVGTSTLRRIMK
jgi:hypothetical protein